MGVARPEDGEYRKLVLTLQARSATLLWPFGLVLYLQCVTNLNRTHVPSHDETLRFSSKKKKKATIHLCVQDLRIVLLLPPKNHSRIWTDRWGQPGDFPRKENPTSGSQSDIFTLQISSTLCTSQNSNPKKEKIIIRSSDFCRFSARAIGSIEPGSLMTINH
jgi:hypothetical protein